MRALLCAGLAALTVPATAQVVVWPRLPLPRKVGDAEPKSASPKVSTSNASFEEKLKAFSIDKRPAVPVDPAQKLSAEEGRLPKTSSKASVRKTKSRSTGGWISDNVFRRVDLTGRRNVGMNFNTVQGDSLAYDSLSNYGQGNSRFTDQGNMQLTGRSVFGVLDFSMNLTDNRFADPQAKQYTLRYNRNGLDLAYGTVQGSLLNTNPLLGFSRSLEGMMGGYNSGRSSFRFVRSQARGDVRSVTIAGTNSPGPYYLQSGRIVNDSLRVLLDGKVQRLGTDFTLDAELGSIVFVDRSIPPTSTLVVSYEAFGIGQNRGSVEGIAGGYDFGRWGRIGYTTVRQGSPGSSTTGVTRELFQGFGDAATGYSLSYVPLLGSVQISVDGVPQIPGIEGAPGGDFFFSTANPVVFYFRRFVSNQQNVVVSYRPKLSGAIGGDRSVSGLDYRIDFRPRRDKNSGRRGLAAALKRPPLAGLPGGIGYAFVPEAIRPDEAEITGAGSYIQLYTATGRSSEGGTGATARGLNAQYDLKGYLFNFGLRDIPSGFVSVEQTGFNRNERATDLSISKRAGLYSYRVESTNSLVYTPATTGASAGTVVAGLAASRLTTMGASMSYAPERGTRWTASQRRNVYRRGASGGGVQDTRLDTTSLSANQRAGRFGITGGLERQNGFGPVTLDGKTSMAGVGIDSLRTSLDYFAGRGVTLTGRSSLSQISSDGRSGAGTDTSLSIGLAPLGAWSGTLTYARSDSGALATLGGFADGFGSGYGQSGFTGGATPRTNYGGSNVRLLSATTNYRAGERLNLSGRFYDATSEGSVTSNASTRALGFGALYDLQGGTLFNMSLDRSITSFLGGTASKSETTTFDAFLSGNPIGSPWSYRLGINTLVSGGGDFAQSGLGFDASLAHRIDDRQRLTFAANFGRTTGYYAQNDNALSALYEYRLFGNVALLGAYRLRNLTNLGPNTTAGGFRSSGLSFELSFDFSR